MSGTTSDRSVPPGALPPPAPNAAAANKMYADNQDNAWRDVLHHPEKEHFRIDRTAVNQLIMNYLVTEGFQEAAEKFEREAGLPTTAASGSISGAAPVVESERARPVDTLRDRNTIRQAIQDGNIEEAISLCSELYPELLDNNAYLYFHLKQQHLLELIRAQRIEEAIEYAQEHLTERCADEPRMMEEIERSMALLAFDDPLNSPFGDLLKMCHRQKVASEVNQAILEGEEVCLCEEEGQSPASPPHPTRLIFHRNMMLVMQAQLERNKVKPERKMDAHARFTDLPLVGGAALPAGSGSDPATLGGIHGPAAAVTPVSAAATAVAAAALGDASAAAAAATADIGLPMAT